MASTQNGETDGQPANLSLNLSSNNPFRNRAASPTLATPPPQLSPASPFDEQSGRPLSRNPFLDPTNKAVQPVGSAAPTTMAASEAAEQKPSTAADLFDALTLEEKKPDENKPDEKKPGAGAGAGPIPEKKGDGTRPPPPPGARPPPHMRRGPPRGENMPPPSRRGPPPGHRPTRSQEDAMRARRAQTGGGRAPGEPTSPQRQRPERRTRRNSESSVADPEKPLTEEEKKAKEARRKERERRHRESKKPTNRRMDIIDQLDATSIFGTGLFHHDGPFDALNPHRNRTGSRAAPMQAFPKDSLNNVLGGSGPLNARPDHAAFMGHADEEAFKDYSGSSKKDEYYPPVASKADIGVFDPMSRGSVLHGDETLGLGTSTFLEGTPAARTAIQKREAETAQETIDSGLQRKKSLAQRIRNINRGPRDYPSGRLTNPDYPTVRSPGDGSGATPGSSRAGEERNPFFDEFDSKAEESISVRRVASPTGMEVTSPTSPRRGLGLERRATADPKSPEEGSSKSGGAAGGGGVGGGLLARVKSLKGSRKPPPAPPAADQESTPALRPSTPQAVPPGSAL